MKRVFLFLSAAAALLTVACNKTETTKVEAPELGSQITFKALAANATKAGELDGTLLSNAYGIYTAATQRNASGLIENASFFSPAECLFATADDPVTAASQWKASPAQFWPIGGVKLDFLAYAQLKANHDVASGSGKWLAVWDNASTDVASKVSFYGVDTYANQEDVLFAAANGMTRENNSPAASDKTVPMTFQHAQALLIFNVKINAEGADKIAINEIGFISDERVAELQKYATDKVIYDAAKAAYDAKKVADGYDAMGDPEKAAWDLANPAPVEPTEPSANPSAANDEVLLKTVGDFSVDNSRNKLMPAWSFGAGACVDANWKMPAGSAKSDANKVAAGFLDYGASISNTADYYQLGETLLVPEQDKVNFTIKYTVGGKVMYYTYNDLRGVWQMGHKYYYNLDLSVNEIVITENVVDFDAEGASQNIGL